jgi:phosphatidylserine/phosphatidylglycerophosphate/cardiolipin synthase-like enzyme
MWRSHPARLHFSSGQNLRLGKIVNEAGGEVLLDERVKALGSHHQKLVVVRRPAREEEDVAFVGGIDLAHGRNDDARHLGDPQAIDLDPRYGPRPAWHDVQAELRGPVVADLALTFRERWEDPTPLDHRNPVRWAAARIARQPRRPDPLPPMPDDPPSAGAHAVQVLRTYPDKRPRLPFAPRGERSIARAYAKAFSRARSLIYIEDQYLWSSEVGRHLASALRRSPGLRIVILVPAYPEQDGRVSGPANRIGQVEALEALRDAGRDRVGVYHIVNGEGRAIYVHAKVCIVDDVWAIVGSDNMGVRSWTHDSELSCAVLDAARDERVPLDPGGLGDHARVFARDLRLLLWREHLERDSDVGLLDPVEAFEAWRAVAGSIRDWRRGGRRGPRPPGRIRHHEPEPVHPLQRPWARLVYGKLVDPDGRPRGLRRSGGL